MNWGRETQPAERLAGCAGPGRARRGLLTRSRLASELALPPSTLSSRFNPDWLRPFVIEDRNRNTPVLWL